ncbi:MAG: hypothetical protein P1U63_06770 [Coxiellaceae bacterium]|nr:hypothetical protein [Coxiellaceae bacterium]
MFILDRGLSIKIIVGIGMIMFLWVGGVHAGPKTISVCSPSNTTDCTPPQHPALGVFYGLPPSTTKPQLRRDSQSNYYTYTYYTNTQYGACTITYADSKFSCKEASVSLSEVRRSLNILTASADDMDLNFVTFKFDGLAINQINSNAYKNAASKYVIPEYILAANAIVNHFNAIDTGNITGVLLDFGSNDNVFISVPTLLNSKGQSLAEEVSLLLSKDKMLNITAGVVGYLPFSQDETVEVGVSYNWNFWAAINRANRSDCSSQSKCQMGVFVYPLYNKSIDWYPFISKTGGTRVKQAFNLTIRDFPYQMRMISVFAAEVDGVVYGGGLKSYPYVINPIKLSAGSFGPPFGYYQLGVMASGTVLSVPDAENTDDEKLLYGNASSYITFDSVQTTKTLTGSRNFWGGATERGYNKPPVTKIIANKCGKAYQSVPNCAVFIQQELIPPPYKSKTKLPYFTGSDILNQYICTQLNAITFIYSNKAAGSKPAQPENFCTIEDRLLSNQPLKFKSVVTRISAVNGPDLVNLVFPYQRADYGTMIGPAIYRLDSNNSSLLAKCLDQYNANKSIKGCGLIPVLNSITSTSNNSALSNFMEWYEANSISPSMYITDIPGYSPSSTGDN